MSIKYLITYEGIVDRWDKSIEGKDLKIGNRFRDMIIADSIFAFMKAMLGCVILNVVTLTEEEAKDIWVGFGISHIKE